MEGGPNGVGRSATMHTALPQQLPRHLLGSRFGVSRRKVEGSKRPSSSHRDCHRGQFRSCSDSIRVSVAFATAVTASSKVVWLACDGCRNPDTLRTYWRAAASIPFRSWIWLPSRSRTMLLHIDRRYVAPRRDVHFPVPDYGLPISSSPPSRGPPGRWR